MPAKKKKVRPDTMDTRLSVTVGQEMAKKEAKKPIYKRLYHHRWGIGLEHEMQVFHWPKPILIKDKIVDFIIYDTKKIVEDILKHEKISLYTRDFLGRIPYEQTGRKCYGKFSLRPVPINMKKQNEVNSIKLILII